MAQTYENLKTFPFFQEDVDLVTFALRRLSNDTGFTNIKLDCEELIEYIERAKKDSERAEKSLIEARKAFVKNVRI
jgi:hypothetical protein